MRAENVLLGKRIAATRVRRGWKKADLARRAGVAPSYVTRVEQGKFDRPSIDQIRLIADALGVSVADLTDPEPVPAGAVDMRAALIAKGFRSHEAPLVDQILDDMARRDDDQREQIVQAVATILAVREQDRPNP